MFYVHLNITANCNGIDIAISLKELKNIIRYIYFPGNGVTGSLFPTHLCCSGEGPESQFVYLNKSSLDR